MYARETSQETRQEVLVAAMREIKLAAIVSTTPDGMHASHLPVLIDERADGQVTLNGHVSRSNPHWWAIGEAAETVAIFQGAHSYISPSWYQTKAETGKVVPTWGYIAVHAHGTLRAVDDAAWLRSHVEMLTDLHERDRKLPWAVSDAPDRYIEVMLRGIVGVQLTVERLIGSWKLNQHRSQEDQASTMAGLASSGEAASREFGEVMAEILRPDED